VLPIALATGNKGADASPRLSRAQLANVLGQFVAANEDASRSTNFASQQADDLTEVVELVANPVAMESDDVALRVLKTLKILSRKFENRVRLGELVVPDLVRVLAEERTSAVLGEAANVVLNVCYERENVQRIIGTTSNRTRSLAIARALTVACTMRNRAGAGGVPPLIALLAKEELDLQVRNPNP
jgi:hypothetical protein